jgi:hypothetical protein
MAMGTTENKKSYEDLDIYKIAIDLAIEVHKITLEDLPIINAFDGLGRKIYNLRKAIIEH